MFGLGCKNYVVFDKIIYILKEKQITAGKQRIYKFTVTKNDIRLMIDNNGEGFADTTFQVREDQFSRLNRLCNEVNNEQPKFANDCNECDTYMLIFYQKEKVVKGLMWNRKTDANKSNRVAEYVNNLVPSIDNVIQNMMLHKMKKNEKNDSL